MANLKFSFLVIATMMSLNSFASISPSSKSDMSGNKQNNSQMINLNMQFKSHNKILKSDLAMPFYQTAELEKKINNKNVLIEVNPRRGKNSNEVAIEIKFFNQSGQKAFAKKEVIAKLGEESKISVKGISMRVTPVLN
jgi:hypothetical protein